MAGVTARINGCRLARENPTAVGPRISVDGFADEEAVASVARGKAEADQAASNASSRFISFLISLSALYSAPPET